MIEITQLIDLIIRPVLMELAPYNAAMDTPHAVALLAGTVAQESSGGKYLQQVLRGTSKGGPALGIFQIEYETYDDLIVNFVDFRSVIGDILLKLSMRCGNRFNLIGNLYFSCAVARLIYWYKSPEPIPNAEDIEGLARYWKKWYNSSAGKGEISDFIDNFNRYVSPYYEKESK